MAKLMHASVPNVVRTDLGREQSLESLEELSHGVGGNPGVGQTMWFNLHGAWFQGRFGSAPDNFHSKVYSESFVSPAATNQGPPLTHRKAKSGGKVGHYLLIQISP